MNSFGPSVLERGRLLSLQPFELAQLALRELLATGPGGGNLNFGNFCKAVAREYGGNDTQVEYAIAEAWQWLDANGLICRQPQGNEWVFVTRAGQTFQHDGRWAQFLSEREMPLDFIHPSLRGACRSSFLRGEFETAVFESYKTLEIAIREAAGFGPTCIGTTLAADAFGKAGPLRDTLAHANEETALMQLMIGGIGGYKNPTSHRRVQIELAEAREMIMLASHLLRIVDARAQRLKN